jgi:hypothetical protein
MREGGGGGGGFRKSRWVSNNKRQRARANEFLALSRESSLSDLNVFLSS